MAVVSIKVFYLITLCSQPFFTLAHNPKEKSFHYPDNMGRQEKWKILNLCDDLFKDSLLKMRQIFEVRNEHEMEISFNVGMIIGRIREKYRFMMETYRDILDKDQNKHYAKPVGIRYLRPLHYIIALEMMHYLEIEIDKLIDVLLDEASDDLKSKHTKVGQTEPKLWYEGQDANDKKNTSDLKMPNKFPSDMTIEPIEQMTTPERWKPPPPPLPGRLRLRSRHDIQLEALAKSKLRQQYLMKKLGMPPNMTTLKKRFLRQWPVEETWALHKYNYDY